MSQPLRDQCLFTIEAAPLGPRVTVIGVAEALVDRLAIANPAKRMLLRMCLRCMGLISNLDEFHSNGAG